MGGGASVAVKSNVKAIPGSNPGPGGFFSHNNEYLLSIASLLSRKNVYSVMEVWPCPGRNTTLASCDLSML